MSLPYSSSIPATDPAKLQECLTAGAVIRQLLENNIKQNIMTRDAFENAVVVVMALRRIKQCCYSFTGNGARL